jgi:hypothetical protein
MQRNKAPWLLHRNIVQINVIDPHHAMQYKTKNNNNKSFLKSQKSLCMERCFATGVTSCSMNETRAPPLFHSLHMT